MADHDPGRVRARASDPGWGTSAPVRSAQGGPHEALLHAVERGRDSPYLAPISAERRRAAEMVLEWRESSRRPVWLDAGCGTGASAAALAWAAPHVLVVGVDKSARRLERAGTLPENCRLARADLVDLWRIAAERGLTFDRQLLLYPNPWPKRGHLRRRWHGHPVFTALLGAGPIELRTNWRTYAEEFVIASGRAGVKLGEPTALRVAKPISPFEEKYAASGHGLWRVRSTQPRGPSRARSGGSDSG